MISTDPAAASADAPTTDTRVDPISQESSLPSHILSPGETLRFTWQGRQIVHVVERQASLAISASLAAGRPLLVRGEPGTGKSQLALAAAKALGRAFVSKVVDARTEARDLFWTFDAIERLARAQVLGALGVTSEEEVREKLEPHLFVSPGPLWWAFDWATASEQAVASHDLVPWRPDGWAEGHGVVVLLDEIDKADSSVANGLLEALGNGAFPGPGRQAAIQCGANQPLIVITTNEERALPDAFLRRCLVLQLALPNEPAALRALLVARGRAHFQELEDEVLEEAASLLAEDRTALVERGLSPPGQAEYLDLLRAVAAGAQSKNEQLLLLRELRAFALQKHPAQARA